MVYKGWSNSLTGFPHFRHQTIEYPRLYAHLIFVTYYIIYNVISWNIGYLIIILLGIMGLWEILTQFYPYLIKEHTGFKERRSLNFIKISNRLTDIFGKKIAIGSETHILGIWGLEQLGSDFDYFKTWYDVPWRHYLCKVVFRYFQWCLAYIQ